MNLPLNQIIHADCLEFMKTLPDKCVDLVLTDPPYGINVAKNGIVGISNSVQAKDYGKQNWDSKIPDEIYFKEMVRISKNQIIWGGITS